MHYLVAAIKVIFSWGSQGPLSVSSAPIASLSSFRKTNTVWFKELSYEKKDFYVRTMHLRRKRGIEDWKQETEGGGTASSQWRWDWAKDQPENCRTREHIKLRLGWKPCNYMDPLHSHLGERPHGNANMLAVEARPNPWEWRVKGGDASWLGEDWGEKSDFGPDLEHGIIAAGIQKIWSSSCLFLIFGLWQRQ